MKDRIQLYFMFALLVMSSCNKPEGRMISFDKYKLHAIVNGTGEPTVIIEGGLRCPTNYYNTLRIAVSQFTRVISYDHAGIGYSTQSPNPRSLPNFVNELYQLLDKEKINPPYILVGHSIGGFTIRYFAHKYPNDVAGLVFMDMPPDNWFNYIRTTHSQADVLKFNKVFDPGQTTEYKGTGLKELEMYEYDTELLKDIKISPSIPVIMLTSIKYEELQQRIGYHPEDMFKWAEMQAEVLKGVLDAKQIITDKSGHFILDTEPELVINSIKELVDKYRNFKRDTLSSVLR